MPSPHIRGPFDAGQIDAFIRDGFVRLDGGFPKKLAASARAALLAAAGGDGSPVVRLPWHGDPVFREIAAQPRLTGAFDQLVGPGRWRFDAVSSFVIRYPSAADPGDTGWHVDMSFGTDAADFLDWQINIASQGRALLLLLLLSDVGDDDAPTRIRIGSHRDVARQIAPAGARGVSLRDLMAEDFGGSRQRREAKVTGEAGMVYLCHPFLVHAAQRHRGQTPRVLAQPPLLPAIPLDPWRDDAVPVERAIRNALA